MVFDFADALESAGLITPAKGLAGFMKNSSDSDFSEGRCLLIHSHRD